MAAKKKRPDPLILFGLLQGQISAQNIALQAICLAVPERRALIEEFFNDTVEELLEGLGEFPDGVRDGAALWAANFSEFLEEDEDFDDEPPEPSNDAKF